ncbi:MAG: hypothetical protein BYD32DRAFT_461590 [Podila humilis]|nr:MAG: hypothetical protein BYD32DRAFT_461590 [Podila humilis]
MLSALSHPSIANNDSDPTHNSQESHTKKDPSIAKSAISSMAQNHYNEPGGLAKGAPDSYDDNTMDYAIETPIHPLAAAPSSHSTSNSPHASRPPLPSQHREESYQTSSTSSFQPQQHQQLLKLKNEHGCPTPVINEAKDDDSYDHPKSPSIPQRSSMSDDASPRFSPSPAQEKNHLVVDTSSSSHLRSPHLLMPETMGTPTTPSTATMTPDTSAPLSSTTNSSAAASTSSSRRGSLRTTTATLPRTALQEETVALFKKYKSLIPCAKCFNRDTIQRDGMSDGNLRFKCRPPVSMSLICNKSYSESKIRNMIAGVVYGYTLPDSGTPTSTTDGSKSNILAFPPPSMPTTKSSRRASQKPIDMSSQHTGGERLDQEDSRDQQMLEQDHRQRLQQQHHRQEDMRRASVQQSQFRRPSAIGGDDSTMMDYDESTMLPPLGRPNRLQVPGTPPLDDESLARSHSTYSLNRGGPTLSSSTRQPQKLHHSRSHPNIGQQRQQQYMDHQDQMSTEHRGSIGGYKSSPHGHPYPHPMRPQAIRRESAPYSSTERRFSYPSQKSSSSTGSKFLPVGHADEALSPALSSSSRSSPGREPVLQPSSSSGPMGDHDNPGTPSMGSLPQGYYDNKGSSSPYQRRMSQPHPSNQPRGSVSSAYTQLPGFSGTSSANKQQVLHYDRRGSEMDEYHYSHREKYEKLNANTLKQYKSRVPYGQESPFMPASASVSHQSPQFENSSLSVFSSSVPVINNRASGGYSPLNSYSPLPQGVRQPPQPYQSSSRRDYAESDTYAPDDQPEDSESRQYARMRGSVKHPVNTNSGNHLYNIASSSGPKDLDSVLPKNTIKLTCFPNSVKTQPEPPTSSSSLETTDAMALNLNQHAKLVIEISQPRMLQSFRSLTSLRTSSSDAQPRDRVIRHAMSQPNLLQRSASSVLGLRRSASPDSMNFGSSKKRRADSVCGGGRDTDDMSTKMTSSSAAATAAAAVVAAAAASAAASSNSSSSGPNLQLIGNDYPSKESFGLGLSSSGASSPAIEALAVARASSYVPLEEQKELGIDYSLFTRVETAGWRILIPPNVTAAFRSEDFGLVLKPKGDEEVEVKEVMVEGEEEESRQEASEAMTIEEDQEHVQGDVVQNASMDAGKDVMGDGGSRKEVQVSSTCDVIAPVGSAAEGMEIEEEMDELEDD